VVWIRRAGFSRSLGAPLLPDLLSTESCDTVASSIDCARIIDLINRRLQKPRNDRSAYPKYFVEGNPATLRRLRDSSRHLLAAECAFFLRWSLAREKGLET
jgi:hypothetical protein